MKKIANKISDFISDNLTFLIVLITVVWCVLFVLFGAVNEDGSITLNGNAPTYSEAQEQAFCELEKAQDEALADLLGFEIAHDVGSGCAPTDTEAAQMGAAAYYSVDISTPAAFYNAVVGKGFNEGYGMQCVAGFKEFMYSLSGKVVATSTGGASGYAKQQSQIEPLGFTWHAGASGLQDGDWAIFSGGTYGHVAMRYQGKWLGQNQGAANSSIGNAFNLLSYGTENVLGYYRPNIYANNSQNSNNTSTLAPVTDNSQNSNSSAPAQPNEYTVQRGDTLGGISLSQGWWSSVEGLYGDDGYAQRLADFNNIVNRGLIYPNQIIRRAE